ncbi:HNH endonuclease [Myxococcus sp. AB025B]|uniref:HNH endonuclease n=1 Tax=Myxococcus sp. AB025B TaxID=2562794 RepID=UPI00114172DA|nr:HNH endonuclease [Myxococcus sp. AB025B]
MSAAPHFHTLTPIQASAENTQDLLHCYDVPTQSLNRLKTNIKSAQPALQRAFCPYCGINSPNTFEHYLPQVDHPEFSVCQYNLVPACGECNSQKGTTWKNATGREIIHYYFDDLPYQSKWLFAKVDLQQNEPTVEFTLKLPLVLNPDVFNLIRSHYAKLNLLERYKARSVEAFSDALGGNRGTLSESDLSELYRARATDYARDFGRNYWKAAIYLAMAESQDFIKFAGTTLRSAA